MDYAHPQAYLVIALTVASVAGIECIFQCTGDLHKHRLGLAAHTLYTQGSESERLDTQPQNIHKHPQAHKHTCTHMSQREEGVEGGVE